MTHSITLRGAPRKRIAAAAVVATLIAPGAAFACNPIEALFGACRMDVFRPMYGAPPEYAPRQRVAPRAKAVVRRPLADSLDADGVSPKQTPIQATAEAPVGSLSLFKQDNTLRNGDIVATSDGFRVYKNGAFSAIAHDGGKLAQLEKASMRGAVERAKPLGRLADRRQ